MKTILFAMTTVSALCAAAPAAAQYGKPDAGGYSNQYYGQASTSFDARIERLQAQLDAGVQQGTINSREAWSVRRQLRDLRRLADQYGTDGLNAREQAYLQDRLRSVREEIRVADGGAYDRYDRRDGYGAYANDDNRAYGNAYSGQGGPYEEADQADICPGGDCLSVGSRVTADLDGVPYQYRAIYRDGNGVYYRSDGRAVYQIDARTDTVLAVIPLPR